MRVHTILKYKMQYWGETTIFKIHVISLIYLWFNINYELNDIFVRRGTKRRQNGL